MQKEEKYMKKPFVTKEQLDEITAKFPTPYHLYDEKGIRDNAKAVKEAFAWNKGYREYFAVKACPNPTLIQIMKEYGFNVIDKEVEKMCNLGEMIEREAKQKERTNRNIMVVKNLVHNLNTTFSNAVELLGLPQQEIDEIKKYFQS